MSREPLLAVDVGNSSTKVGLFNEPAAGSPLPQPVWTRSTETASEPFSELAASLPDVVAWRVASVHRAAEQRLAQWVRQARPRDGYELLTCRDLPLDVHVDYPDRVGVDRLAAAVGANALRERGRAAVVIDAGSALTVDLLSPEGAFEGGVILPGFRMSARALSTADQLPEVLFQSSAEPPPVLGKNTEGAIKSGLFWGAVGAVREIIERYAEAYRRPQVFVTGGDLQRLAPLVSAEAQFVPNLVLSGIALATTKTND